jgi:tetratricopeptide (TPR) repeat protein
MKFVAAKCPSCQGELQVPDDRDFVKCMYCGVEVKVRESILLHVENHLPEYLNLAKTEEQVSNFQQADYYYTKVLELDGKNSEAWFGKGNIILMLADSIDYNMLETRKMKEYFNNAIQCSDNPEIVKYRIENFICSKISVEIMTGIDVKYENEMGNLMSLSIQSKNYIDALEYGKELNTNHIFNLDPTIQFNCETPEQLILTISTALYHVDSIYKSVFQDCYNKYYYTHK